MKIEDKIDLYLGEKSSRKDAFAKAKKVLKSVKTHDQLKVAAKMLWNYNKLYGESFFGDLGGEFGAGNSLMGLNSQEEFIMNLLTNKSDQLKHIAKLNK